MHILSYLSQGFIKELSGYVSPLNSGSDGSGQVNNEHPWAQQQTHSDVTLYRATAACQQI